MTNTPAAPSSADICEAQTFFNANAKIGLRDADIVTNLAALISRVRLAENEACAALAYRIVCDDIYICEAGLQRRLPHAIRSRTADKINGG